MLVNGVSNWVRYTMKNAVAYFLGDFSDLTVDHQQ